MTVIDNFQPTDSHRSDRDFKIRKPSKKHKSVIAQAQKAKLMVESYCKGGDCVRMKLIDARNYSYQIVFSKNPVCTCQADLPCVHTSWILLNIANIPADDEVLCQKGYTSSEYIGILIKFPSEIAAKYDLQVAFSDAKYFLVRKTWTQISNCKSCLVQLQHGQLHVVVKVKYPVERECTGRYYPSLEHSVLSSVGMLNEATCYSYVS